MTSIVKKPSTTLTRSRSVKPVPCTSGVVMDRPPPTTCKSCCKGCKHGNGPCKDRAKMPDSGENVAAVRTVSTKIKRVCTKCKSKRKPVTPPASTHSEKKLKS